jgi:hypothetical protein
LAYYPSRLQSKNEDALFCNVFRLHKSRLENECDQISPLQSWGPELRYFTELRRRPIMEKDCDITIEKPTFILKIDASKWNCLIFK